MAPHVAVIVVGVVVGVGVAYVVGQHIYPEVKPHVEGFFRAWKENRRRRSEHPYQSMPSEDFDGHNTVSPAESESKEMEDQSFQGSQQASTGVSTARSVWGEGLRQRSQPGGSSTANEKLLDNDVEMVQLDKGKTNFYPLMTPTSNRPQSRGPTTPPPPAEDVNPFEEPSVPVGVAIPLPQSPDTSLVLDPLDRSTPALSLSRSQLPNVTSHNEQSDEQTPIATSAPRLPSAPPRRASIPSPRAHHRQSESISSVLGPAALPAGEMGTIRGIPPSFAARASSPSNGSDHMSGSFVSAAPSRNWTDGGTADIFSGSERESGYHDSDEDGVRSASDSEWEEIDSAARVASPPAQGHRGRN